MTPLFKFSLLGLGAASAGGSYICWNQRETIREYFRGPVSQAPTGSRGGDTVLPGGEVQTQNNSVVQETTRSPAANPALDPQPQDIQQQVPPGGPAQERRDQPADNQDQVQQEQQGPSGGLESRDPNPGQPQGPRVNAADPANGPQNPGEVVNHVPGPGPVEVPGAEVPREDGALPGQQKADLGGLDEHSSSNKAEGGPVDGGGAEGSLPLGDRAQTVEGNPAPGSGVSEPGAGALPGPGGVGDSPAEPSPDGQRGLPAPAADTTDYQCLLNVGNYDTANKKAIKDFFDSRSMGSNQGVQILNESYENGFKCARDMDDSELEGLKDYIEKQDKNFTIQGGNRKGNEPMVWAFKKDSSNNNEWTMYDDANVDSETLDEDGERGGILIAKTAKAEKGSGE